MPDPFFYLFSLAALVSGALVIFKRDPLISALFLIVTLCNVAAIYLFFGAGFLAAIQIIVYAGAVMVLFLFITMLLPTGEMHEGGTPAYKRGVVAISIFFAIELLGLLGVQSSKALSGGTPDASAVTISTIGLLLFDPFLIPLELVSFILLVAVMGVVMLTGKDKKQAKDSIT